MRWQDVSVDGVWTIPHAPREKETAGTLALPNVALAIIKAQPRIASNEFVFAGRGAGPVRGFGMRKTAFDDKLPDVAPWVIHDLRRTARSLLSRAGVLPHIAERVLGHAVGGIEGVYDRHSYLEEKADALRRLAALIDSIVSPRAKNERPLQRSASR
jgi:integrase